MVRRMRRIVPKRRKTGVKIRVHLRLNFLEVQMLDHVMDYIGWDGSRDAFVREYVLDIGEFFSSHIPDLADNEGWPIAPELVALADSYPSFSERFGV